MKNYIKPVTKVMAIKLTSMIAESGLSAHDEQGDGSILGNEDFGWGDDEDPASWNWKNN